MSFLAHNFIISLIFFVLVGIYAYIRFKFGCTNTKIKSRAIKLLQMSGRRDQFYAFIVLPSFFSSPSRVRPPFRIISPRMALARRCRRDYTRIRSSTTYTYIYFYLTQQMRMRTNETSAHLLVVASSGACTLRIQFASGLTQIGARGRRYCEQFSTFFLLFRLPSYFLLWVARCASYSSIIHRI